MFNGTKKIVSIALIISLVLTNANMSLFAATTKYFSAANNEIISEKLSHKYYDEFIRERKFFLDANNILEDQKNENNENEKQEIATSQDKDNNNNQDGDAVLNAKADKDNDNDNATSSDADYDDESNNNINKNKDTHEELEEDDPNKNVDSNLGENNKGASDNKDEKTNGNEKDNETNGDGDIASKSDVEDTFDENDNSKDSGRGIIDISSLSEIKKDSKNKNEIEFDVILDNNDLATLSEISNNIASVSDIGDFLDVASDSVVDLNPIDDNNLFGDVPDSDKYVLSGSWYENLGFTTNKTNIVKIEFYPTFGSYYKDDTSGTNKEPIVWDILDESNPNKTLLISHYLLAEKKYNDSGAGTTWKDSSLRTWLNGTFLDAAFSTAEQGKIDTTNVSNASSENYANRTNGEDTDDKIFILSYKEANSTYYSSNGARIAYMTAYAKGSGSTGTDAETWWLRSPGYMSSYQNAVFNSGVVMTSGDSVNATGHYVRPALWVNLPSRFFKETKPTSYTERKTISASGIEKLDAYILSDGTIKIFYRSDYIKLDNDMSNFFGETAKGKFTNLTTIENAELLPWDTVTNMSKLFYGCTNLQTINLPENFGQNATNMESMFEGTKITSIPAKLATSKATNMKSMFKNCDSITTFDFSKLSFSTADNIDVSNMFSDCDSLTTININSNMRELPTKVTTSTGMFSGCTNLIGGAGYKYNANHTDGEFARVDYGGMLPGYFTYNGTIPIDYTGITMFFKNNWYNSTIKPKSEITEIKFCNSASDIANYNSDFVMYNDGGVNYYAQIKDNTVIVNYKSGIKVKADIDWSAVFKDLSGITNIVGLDTIDTADVKDLSGLFDGTESLVSLTIPSGFGVNVEDMSNLFANCDNLTSLTLPSNFGSNATNMEGMFEGTKLTGMPANLNTSKATNMKSMFKDCENIVTFNFNDLVFNATNDIDISNMFEDCVNLTTVNVSSDMGTLPARITTASNVFAGCINLKGGSGFKYDPNFVDGEFARVDRGGLLPGYFTYAGTGTHEFDLGKISLPANAIENKENITKIKFYTDTDMGTYSTNGGTVIYTDTSGVNYYGYIDGTTLKIHWRDGFTLKMLEDYSGGFEGWTGLTSIEGLDKVDYSNVTNMSKMFATCSNLVSLTLPANFGANATNMESMFENTKLVNYPTNLNTSNVTNMKSMFKNCDSMTSFDFSKISFNTINNVDISNMFNGCDNLVTVNIDTNLGKLPDKVTVTTDMFKDCTKLVGGAGYKYNPNHIDGEFARVDLGGMLPGYFTYNGSTPIDYSSINFEFRHNWFNSAVKSKSEIKRILFTNLPNDISNYDSDFVMYTNGGKNYYAQIKGDTVIINFKDGINLKAIIDLSNVFQDFTSLIDIDGFELMDLSQAENLQYSFANIGIEKITINSTISNAIDLRGMFANCATLSEVTFGEKFDTSDATDMSGMFANCKNLTTIKFSKNFTTENVTNMSRMFEGCEKLASSGNMRLAGNGERIFGAGNGEIDLSNFDTENVTDMSSMFKDCKDVKKVFFGSGINTENVNDMSSMFENCESIVDIDTASFSVIQVTDMSNMFKNCKVIDAIDLASFETSALTNTSGMFENCSNLEVIIASSSFSVAGVVIDANMFTGCDKLVGGEGTSYSEALISTKSYAVVDKGAAEPGYFTWGNAIIRYMGGDGAVGSMPDEEAERRKPHPLQSNAYTKPGYNFVQWKDQDGKTYPKNGSIPKVMKSLDLTAEWASTAVVEVRERRIGTGGGGTGGGGGGLIQKAERSVNFVMQTPIRETEYTWIYDNKGIKNGLLLKTNSMMGNAMLQSDRTKGCYTLIGDGSYMQIGGGGIYGVYENGGLFYYGFDTMGQLMTGFIETSEKTKMLTINQGVVSFANTGFDENIVDKIFIENKGKVAKYYLFEGENICKGVLWTTPMVINGVKYLFDNTGCVVSSSDTPITQGIWEYNPVEDKWRYFVPDTEGRATYYKDYKYEIYHDGQVHSYIFDKNGNMLTGNIEFNGKTYYGQESGEFKGSVIQIK